MKFNFIKPCLPLDFRNVFSYTLYSSYFFASSASAFYGCAFVRTGKEVAE